MKTLSDTKSFIVLAILFYFFQYTANAQPLPPRPINASFVNLPTFVNLSEDLNVVVNFQQTELCEDSVFLFVKLPEESEFKSIKMIKTECNFSGGITVEQPGEVQYYVSYRYGSVSETIPINAQNGIFFSAKVNDSPDIAGNYTVSLR